MVVGAAVSHDKVGLEGVEELLEDLDFGLPALDHFRVLLSIVDSLDVVNVDCSVSILVQNGEGFVHEALSEGVERSGDASQELVIVD